MFTFSSKSFSDVSTIKTTSTIRVPVSWAPAKPPRKRVSANHLQNQASVYHKQSDEAPENENNDDGNHVICIRVSQEPEVELECANLHRAHLIDLNYDYEAVVEDPLQSFTSPSSVSTPSPPPPPSLTSLASLVMSFLTLHYYQRYVNIIRQKRYRGCQKYCKIRMMTMIEKMVTWIIFMKILTMNLRDLTKLPSTRAIV